MKITCQSCQSKYTIADDKIQGKVAKIKCRKCGATIVVDAAAAPADQAADESWSVIVTEGDQRTMTIAELAAAFQSGVVTGETFVWRDGMGDWEPLQNRADLFAAVGGGEAAPAADEPFEVAAAEPAPAGKPTGARDEQSVLFSLAALTATSSRASVAPSAPKSSTKEDSGLIDLNALAKANSEAPAPEAPAPTPFMFPAALGTVEAPVAAAPAAPPPEPAKKSNTGMFIGIAVAVAGIAIAGAIVATRGHDEPTPAIPSATAAVTATATATATVTAPPAETASAAPAASASAASAKKAAPVAAAGAGAGAKGGAAPAKTAATPAATTPPAAPPAAGGAKKGNCGCAAGDMMCAIRCSAQGK